MKFSISDITKLTDLIAKRKIVSLLLHGPNTGLAMAIFEQVTKKLNLYIQKVSATEIDASALALLAGSTNFFGQREVIRIDNTSNVINKDLKHLLGNSNLHNFICFIADQQLKPSGIRKFFEDSPNLAIIACYYDDSQTINKMISQMCHRHNKKLDDDALSYLRANLKGDYQLIKNELEKLINYSADQDQIELNDVVKVLSSNDIANSDEMCICFASKDYKEFLIIANKIIQNGINEILIIRGLMRYYLNLYQIKTRIDDGSNIDIAMKKLPYPIFFKYVSQFKSITKKTSLQEIIDVLKKLQDSEKSFKNNSRSFDIATLCFA